MGYFDDPKHKAQWEKELSALREEKARIKAGIPPVSEQEERTADRNIERTSPEDDFVAEEKLNETAEETVSYQAPEMETPDQPVHSEKAENDLKESTEKAAHEEKAEEIAEDLTEEKTEEKAPAKQPAQRTRPEGIYREKITFQELLRMENMDTPVRLTQKPHEKERQKEVSNEL